MNVPKQYLGDSVYAEYVENEATEFLVLTTENGDKPSNKIYLDNCVYTELLAYVDHIRKVHEQERENLEASASSVTAQSTVEQNKQNQTKQNE